MHRFHAKYLFESKCDAESRLISSKRACAAARKPKCVRIQFRSVSVERDQPLLHVLLLASRRVAVRQLANPVANAGPGCADFERIGIEFGRVVQMFLRASFSSNQLAGVVHLVHHEHPVALAVERRLRSDVLEPRVAQLKPPGTLPPLPLARSPADDSARRGIHRARSRHLLPGRVASVSETAQSEYAKHVRAGCGASYRLK